MSQDNQLSTRQPSDMAMGVFSSAAMYGEYHKIATNLANSTLIPKEFQGNPSNVMIALNLSSRMNADPLAIMQSMYIVHGKPSFSASFMAAVIEESGKFGHLSYEMCGSPGQDDYGCRVTSTIASTGEAIQGTWVTVKMAKAEGWWSKSGSKWPNMTEQMLRYRAVAFFGRLFAGSVLLGMQTSEEMDDIKDINPIAGQSPVSKADLKDSLVSDVEVIDPVKDEKPAATKKAPPKKKAAAKAEKKEEAAAPQKEEEAQPTTSTAATGEEKGASGNPWTPEGLIKQIETAEDIETVNEALSCTSGFSQVNVKAVMTAAKTKNKELAAARNK